MNAEELEEMAISAERSHDWKRACELFLALAHYFKDIGEFDNASVMFMRAATAGERDEDWRKLGQLWVQCASSVNHRIHGAVTDMVDDADASRHYFPTLDIYAWERFGFHEQLGRAWRNAAYHLEQSGANQTAYVQYGRSGDAFYDGKMWAEASRSYYHALLSFVERHGEIDQQMQQRLDRSNEILINEDCQTYLRRAQMYERGLAAELLKKGNVSAASVLFCREAEITRKIALIDKRLGKWLVYTLWKYSSGYGNNPGQWALWVAVLFGMLFPFLFSIDGVLKWNEVSRSPTWIDYIYFSVTTVTTGFDSSFAISSVGKIVALVETITGFVMLGFLLTFLNKKVSR